jgi:hypothetical protein
MAQITAIPGGGKITWDGDDFVSGLAPNYGASTSAYQKGNRQLASARSMNPFRSYGNAYPGFAATDVSGVAEVTDIALKGVVSGTSAYIVTLGDKLQKVATLNGTPALAASWQLISTTMGGGHSGHSPVGSDIVLYNAKVGGTAAVRAFYSWQDGTDWDVGTFDLSTTFDSDFMSTAPATPLDLTSAYEGGAGDPHPLIVGEDDILYIGDRNFVHAYDGQNAADDDGKFFPAVLTLQTGWIITSFAKTQTGLMIFAYFANSASPGSSYFYKGQAKAFLWNYVDLDFTYAYDLNDNYVTESFSYKGAVGCFTQGRSNDPSQSNKVNKLQIFNGSTFEKVQSYIGNLPVRGGVDIDADAIYWNADGILHSWGSPLLGVKSGLNKLAEGAGTTSGMLANFTGSTMFMSSGTTTSGGLQTLSSNYYFQASLSTPIVEPAFPMGQRGRIKYVKIKFADITTSANSLALTVTLVTKGSAVTTVLSNHTDVGYRTQSLDRYLDSSGNALPNFEAVKLVLQWGAGNGTTTAPGISSVECIYENVNI